MTARGTGPAPAARSPGDRYLVEVSVGALPSYVPEPVPRRPAGQYAVVRWSLEFLEGIESAADRRATTPHPAVRSEPRGVLVISRVVELAPDEAVQALARWEAHARETPITFHHHRFELSPPARWSRLGEGHRIPVRVHRRCRLLAMRVDLELVPWSSTRTELDLRPRGAAARALQAACSGRLVPARWANRYFNAGHAVADAVAAAVLREATITPRTAPRTA